MFLIFTEEIRDGVALGGKSIYLPLSFFGARHHLVKKGSSLLNVLDTVCIMHKKHIKEVAMPLNIKLEDTGTGTGTGLAFIPTCWAGPGGRICCSGW